MKQKQQILLIIFLIVFICLQSCTIKKRLYQPGYQVEWHSLNKNQKSRSLEEVNKNIDIRCEERSTMQTPLMKLDENNYSSETENFYADNTNELTELSLNNPNIIINNSTNKNRKQDIEKLSSVTTTKFVYATEAKHAKPNKIHILAIIGPSMSLIADLLALIGFLSSLSITFLLIVLALAGFITSAMAWSDIKQQPNYYRGKALAILGTLINPVTFFLLAITTFIIVTQYTP